VPITPNRISPNAFAAFQTNDQRQSLATRSPQKIDEANEKALQAAIAASLNDDGMTSAQRFARETGDPDAAKWADDEALAMGINASLHEASAPAALRSSVPNEEFAAQSGLIGQLKHNLRAQGFKIWPNRGAKNNCLIISMLQHATGDYRSQHSKQAEHYKQLLVKQSGGTERIDSPLYSDEKLTRWLISKINRDYFGDRREDYLSFRLVTAGLDGQASERVIGNGKRIAGILDGAGHYEAFTPRPPR
jgi:hypothetical protein